MKSPVETAVPFVDLVGQHAPLRSEILEAVGRVLDHGRFILGPEVEELERRWADICAVRHAVSVSDGTMALLRACCGRAVYRGRHRSPRLVLLDALMERPGEPQKLNQDDRHRHWSDEQ
jgi:hypothetical protein